MKRLLVFALTLSLLLCARAEKAYGTLDGKHIFSVEYDENVFAIDTSRYADENASDFRFHFLLQSDQNDVLCCMQYVPEYADFSGFSASDAEFRDYLSSFDDEDVEGVRYEYAETYRVKLRNGAREAELPFAVFMVDDKEEGMDSCYAETVSHGWVIYIEVYNNRNDTVGVEDLRLLKSILNTFSPISNTK